MAKDNNGDILALNAVHGRNSTDEPVEVNYKAVANLISTLKMIVAPQIARGFWVATSVMMKVKISLMKINYI